MRSLAVADLEGTPRRPLEVGAVAAYLADPRVVHWVADSPEVLGHLLCYVQRRRCDDPLQLQLYEIVVAPAHRRRGIGRSLVMAMVGWMREQGIAKVWLLAEPGDAEAFYAACGFARTTQQPAQMQQRVD